MTHGQIRSEPFGMAAGWVAALLLHGGLLLAVILDRPGPVPQIPGRAAISLVLQAPGPKPLSAPVAPRPSAMPAARPAAAPAFIANTPVLPRIKPKPAALAKARPATPAPRRAVLPAAQRVQNTAARPVPAPGPQGFVAAEPLPGNVNQPPEYPPAALAHGEQGQVLLSIHVLPNGLTDFVSVTQSSGYRILDQAAADAVMKWRFQPATAAGRPAVMVIPFWINFDLQTQQAQPAGAPPAGAPPAQ